MSFLLHSTFTARAFLEIKIVPVHTINAYGSGGISPLIFNFSTIYARKLHNEELRDLYYLPNIVWVVKLRRMRWAGNVAHMAVGRGVYGVLVGRPEGKRPLGGPRRRWDDNIKMDLQEVEWGCGDRMELSQDRDRDRCQALVSTVMCR
jgi:hypothetical protein